MKLTYTAIVETQATFADVLDGSAHIIADGDCLRASVPALTSGDPDASLEAVVNIYPTPGMPDHREVFRLLTTDPASLETAMRERYASVSVEWDD